jgi:hypothetical protein
MTRNFTLPYLELFANMETSGILDVDSDACLYALHYVFLPDMEKTLQFFVDTWKLD